MRQLHEAFPHRDPTKLRENEVLDFLISLRQQRKLKDSTVNQAVCALRAFYRDHLGRQWKGWSRIKIRRDEQLPNVLSREEVARFLGSVKEGRFRAVFTLMYHCGLRLGEKHRGTEVFWTKRSGARRLKAACGRPESTHPSQARPH